MLRTYFDKEGNTHDYIHAFKAMVLRQLKELSEKREVQFSIQVGESPTWCNLLFFLSASHLSMLTQRKSNTYY